MMRKAGLLAGIHRDLDKYYSVNRSLDIDYTFDNNSMVSISIGYFFMINWKDGTSLEPNCANMPQACER